MFLEAFGYFKTLCYSNRYHIKIFYLLKSKFSVKILKHDDIIICHLIMTNYQKQIVSQQASLAQGHQHKAIIHQIKYKD